jgi:CubicO group peptidase (beta-lactamase class C family)
VKDGKVVFAKGYGVREYGKPEKVDENSLFAIASNSKAFTVAALSKLVSEGKISWTDPIRKYLPWFELYDPWVSNKITIADAVCHNSGLGTFSGDLLWYETKYTTREVLERTKHLKPDFDFRAGYGYSNLMFSAAGEVIEVVTGKKWAEYVKENFLKPLGMRNTNTSVKELAANKDVAIPHAVQADGSALPIPYLSWDNCPAAAAINSSVADMSKWMIMQLNGGTADGKTYIAKDQLETARQIHNPQEVRRSMASKSSFHGYGFGWDIYDLRGTKIINHGGGSDGMISKVTLVPGENFGFVILTNSINWLPSALANSILDDYFGLETSDYSANYLQYKSESEQKEAANYQAAKLALNPKAVATHPLEAFVGTYSGDLYGEVKVFLENGHLVADFVPAPNLIGDLTHWEYNTFEINLRHTPLLPRGKVNFVLDMDGKPDELKIDIPNPDFFFTELILKKVKD